MAVERNPDIEVLQILSAAATRLEDHTGAMGTRFERDGWRVLEVAHVLGTTVTTCRVAAHRSALAVGSVVRRGDAVFSVEEILSPLLHVGRLEPETEGQVVLSGPDVESLNVDDFLVLAIPCPVCGAVELSRRSRTRTGRRAQCWWLLHTRTTTACPRTRSVPAAGSSSETMTTPERRSRLRSVTAR